MLSNGNASLLSTQLSVLKEVNATPANIGGEKPKKEIFKSEKPSGQPWDCVISHTTLKKSYSNVLTQTVNPITKPATRGCCSSKSVAFQNSNIKNLHLFFFGVDTKCLTKSNQLKKEKKK